MVDTVLLFLGIRYTHAWCLGSCLYVHLQVSECNYTHSFLYFKISDDTWDEPVCVCARARARALCISQTMSNMMCTTDNITVLVK
jgi:acyl-CoA thioesterase FadM